MVLSIIAFCWLQLMSSQLVHNIHSALISFFVFNYPLQIIGREMNRRARLKCYQKILIFDFFLLPFDPIVTISQLRIAIKIRNWYPLKKNSSWSNLWNVFLGVLKSVKVSSFIDFLFNCTTSVNGLYACCWFSSVCTRFLTLFVPGRILLLDISAYF